MILLARNHLGAKSRDARARVSGMREDECTAGTGEGGVEHGTGAGARGAAAPQTHETAGARARRHGSCGELGH